MATSWHIHKTQFSTPNMQPIREPGSRTDYLRLHTVGMRKHCRCYADTMTGLIASHSCLKCCAEQSREAREWWEIPALAQALSVFQRMPRSSSSITRKMHGCEG